MEFPDISPVALAIDPLTLFGVTVGPFFIRWYALAYLSGFLLGWWGALTLNGLYGSRAIPRKLIDDFILWVVAGVILGGRLGYVLFYQTAYYLQNPSEILMLWHGGMSFHGGASGVILAIIAFSLFHKIRLFHLADIVCAVVPIGLFFGRLANFINGELYGRATDLPWGMVFPASDGQPRHPSQLYEALTEGLLLFLLLQVMMRVGAVRNRPGIVAATFLAGYATFRFLIEFVREPDVQLGILPVGLTMGQLLCLPMLAGAGLVILIARRHWIRQ